MCLKPNDSYLVFIKQMTYFDHANISGNENFDDRRFSVLRFFHTIKNCIFNVDPCPMVTWRPKDGVVKQRRVQNWQHD